MKKTVLKSMWSLLAVVMLFCGSGSAVAQPGAPVTMALHEWSFDGRYVLGDIVSGPRLNTVCLWDTRTGEIVQTFGETEYVMSAALSLDRRHVLTAGKLHDLDMENDVHGYDESVRIWNGRTGRLLRRVETANVGHRFTPDGRHYTSRGPYITMADVETGEDRFVFKGRHVLFSEDSSQAAAIDGGLVTVWDINRGLEILRYEHEDGYHIAPTADRLLDRIVLIDTDGSLHVRSLRSGDTIYEVPVGETAIDRVHLSKSGATLTVVYESGKVDHHDVEVGRLIKSFETRTARPSARLISPDDKHLAGMIGMAGRQDNRVWELETGRMILQIAPRDSRLKIPLGNGSGLNLVSFSPDGRRLLLVDSHKRVAVVAAVPSGAIVSEVSLERFPYPSYLIRPAHIGVVLQ